MGKISLLLFYISIAFAGELEIILPQESAMGGAGISASFALNPAVRDEDFYCLMAFQRLFGLKELPHFVGATEITKGSQSFGALLSQLRVAEYRETQMRLSYSRTILKKTMKTINIGFSIGKFTSEITSVDTKGDTYASFGILAKLLEMHKFGFVYQNIPLKGSSELFGKKFGFGYQFVATAAEARVDWIKDIRYPLSIRFGAEANPFSDFLYLRCGYQTEPQTIGFGLGLNLEFKKRKIVVNYSFRIHEQLPLQQQVSLQFIFDEKRIQ